MATLVSPGLLKRIGGASSSGVRPLFFPLTTTLVNVFGGDSAAAAIRNSTASVNVYDDTASSIIRTAAVNEHRAEGHRRGENEQKQSGNLLDAAWNITANVTVSDGVADPRGGTTAFTLTADAGNVVFGANRSGGAIGDTYGLLVWIRRRTGTGTISLVVGDNVSQAITVTDSWQLFYAKDILSGTTIRDYFKIATSGDEIDVWIPHLENVTGRAAGYVPEYVATEAAAVSKYFTTANANTVSSNVVTEAVGDPLFPTKNIDGAVWNDTKPDWATGAWAAGSYCNHENKWYSTVAGGTDSATFGDTITWVEQGLHNNIYGLLTEPLGENLSTYSEQADHANWTNLNVAITPNSAVAADGATTADTLGNDAVGAATYHYSYQTPTLTQNATYTVSRYVEYVSGTGWVWLLGEAGSNIFCFFNVLTGVIGTTTNFDNATIDDVGGGIYRISATFTKTSGTAAENVGVGICIADGTPNWDSTGVANQEQVYIWGAQLEESPVPTSYIPTTTAAVTRATEVGTLIWALANNFNNPAGVVIADFIFASDKKSSGGNRGLISVANSATSLLFQASADGKFQTWDGANSATNTTAYVAGKAYRLMVKFNDATNKQRVGIKDLSTYGATTAWGTEGTYDGAFTLGTYLRLVKDILEPTTFRNLPVIYAKDMLVSEIEAKYS